MAAQSDSTSSAVQGNSKPEFQGKQASESPINRPLSPDEELQRNQERERDLLRLFDGHWSHELLKHVIIQSAAKLTDRDRAEVADALGFSPQQVDSKLMEIVVRSFAFVLKWSFVVLGLSLLLTFHYGFNSSTDVLPISQIVLTVFTTAVGFLSGLFAPSPFSREGRGASVAQRLPASNTAVQRSPLDPGGAPQDH